MSKPSFTLPTTTQGITVPPYLDVLLNETIRLGKEKSLTSINESLPWESKIEIYKQFIEYYVDLKILKKMVRWVVPCQ